MNILAEYQDLWTVERKWNSKHKLEAHFEKRPGTCYVGKSYDDY